MDRGPVALCDEPWSEVSANAPTPPSNPLIQVTVHMSEKWIPSIASTSQQLNEVESDARVTGRYPRAC